MPSEDFKIEEGDYITFVGNAKQCLKLFNLTFPEEI